MHDVANQSPVLFTGELGWYRELLPSPRETFVSAMGAILCWEGL